MRHTQDNENVQSEKEAMRRAQRGEVGGTRKRKQVNREGSDGSFLDKSSPNPQEVTTVVWEDRLNEDPEVIDNYLKKKKKEKDEKAKEVRLEKRRKKGSQKKNKKKKMVTKKKTLAKYLLRELPSDHPDHETKWECMLWNHPNQTKPGTRGNTHHRFIAKGRGHASVHLNTWHPHLKEALTRHINECKEGEEDAVCAAFIESLKTPVNRGQLERFVIRFKEDPRKTEREAYMLVWFINGLLPFSTADDPHFRAFLDRCNDGGSTVTVSSSTTIKQKVLPLLYDYCIHQITDLLGRATSYNNSYDLWTGINKVKYISQSYWFITLPDFKLHCVVLDFFSIAGPKYKESIAAALKTRQNYWTADLPSLISAMGVADCASDVQSGGALLWDEDFGDVAEEDDKEYISNMLQCMNHRLHKVISDAIQVSGMFYNDYGRIEALCSKISQTMNVNRALKDFQASRSLDELSVVMANETRWEGVFLCLKRFQELREALEPEESPIRQWEEFDTINAAATLTDFLDRSFWRRLEDYIALFDPFSGVTKFFQGRTYPTGCFVPHCIHYLFLKTSPAQDDGPHAKFLKDALRNSIEDVLVRPYLQAPNNFIKAALMHPALAAELPNFISNDVLTKCWESLCTDAAMFTDGDDEQTNQLQEAMLKLVVRMYQSKINAQFPDPQEPKELPLLKDEKYNGVDAFKYWRTCPQDIIMLKNVAAMMLALPAGEANDERTFSVAGNMLTRNRNRLGNSIIEMVIVIRIFMREFHWKTEDVIKWLSAQSINIQ